MNEYAITVAKGFDQKTEYVKADSAEEVQHEFEEKMAFEISEGLQLVSITKL